MSGYFGIGVFHPKTAENIGALYRSAFQLGASFIFTIGKRYSKAITDTYCTYRSIPLIQFKDLQAFANSPFYDCRVVGIEKYRDKEIESVSLNDYKHLNRCMYLLGSEDGGLSREALDVCHELIEIPSERQFSYNVAMAGTIVMWDRFHKNLTPNPTTT